MKKMILKILMVLGLLFVLFLLINYVRFTTKMSELKETLSNGSMTTMTSYGELEYAIEGSGRPILVIHGAGGGYDQGLLLAKTFASDEEQLIAISRPGFLGTPLTNDNQDVEAHVEMYAELLNKLELNKVHVLAFSDGGPSAELFAIRYPEFCESLTLVAAKSKTPPPETWLQKVVFSNIFKADYLFWLITEYNRGALLSMFGVEGDVQKTMSYDESKLINDFLDAMQPMSLRIDGIMNERNKMTTLAPSVFDLSLIQSPTLILHAKDDHLQHYNYAEYSYENIENAQLISYDKGGHMLIGQLANAKDTFLTFISGVHNE